MKHTLVREYLIPNKYIGCVCYCPSHKTETSASLNGNIAKCSLCGGTFETHLNKDNHIHTLEERMIRVGEKDVCRTIETYCSECGVITSQKNIDDHDFVVMSLGKDKDTLKCAHCGYDATINK